jgi:hypothetical protein
MLSKGLSLSLGTSKQNPITGISIDESSVSHGSKYEDDFFWDVAPCNLVETD